MAASKKHPAHYVGASNNERPVGDLYETPAAATRALQWSLERQGYSDLLSSAPIWEPACGRGAISEVFRAAGYSVMSTDIYDHGYNYNDSAGPVDFFSDKAYEYARMSASNTIITNPPYKVKQNDRWLHVEDWVTRAFEFPGIEDVFYLLKTTALAGKSRSIVMEKHLYHLFQFRGRISMGTAKQNMIDFGWMWFRRGPLRAAPTISWIED